MFRVRVNKIESTRDLDGNLGKRIELLEEQEVNPYVLDHNQMKPKWRRT